MNEAIWLRRHGDEVEVLIEHEGKWHLLIKEFAEAPFSHIIEPAGIKSRIEGTEGVAA